MRRRELTLWAVGLAVSAVWLAGCAWQQADAAWTVTPELTLLKTLLFQWSWLMWPLLALALTSLRRGYFPKVWGVGLAGLMVLGIYARFVEPNLLWERHTVIKAGYTLRVALISDLHCGLFSTPARLERLVDRLNALDVQAVLVAGDWTYEPPRDEGELAALLAPLARLRHPVYSVPGNHDEEKPGPHLQDALRQALLKQGVIPLEGRQVVLGPVRLVGLGDLWAGKTKSRRLKALAADGKPLLLLVHHPGTVEYLPKLPAPVLMLAGHTHGGQVRLPVLTEKMLSAAQNYGFRSGLHQRRQGQVFVTSGIGMVGLPIRFAVPPVIDVLEMR